MTFYLKEANTAAVYSTVVKDEAGSAVNVTGATARFHVYSPYGILVVDEAMTIDDAAAGEVSYAWAADDLTVGLVYRAEIEITYSNSKVQTFPNNGYITIEVERKLA